MSISHTLLLAFKLRRVYKGLFHQSPLSVLDFLWLFTTSLIILCGYYTESCTIWSTWCFPCCVEYKIQKKLVYIFICGEISQSSLWMFHFLLVFSGVSLIYGEMFCCSLEAFFSSLWCSFTFFIREFSKLPQWCSIGFKSGKMAWHLSLCFFCVLQVFLTLWGCKSFY